MVAFFVQLIKCWAAGDAVLTVYLLPWVLAWYRRVPGIRSIAVINIALGWTVALEQGLALAVLAIVSVLGTWPPALYSRPA